MITKPFRRVREKWYGVLAGKTDADTIEMANDTEFGLAAYFYSRNIGLI